MEYMNYDEVNEYIEGLYENDKLSQKHYSEETELEEYGQVIDDEVARMLQVLILASKPKRVLEIGTSIGFSTVMMAKAMKHYGGRIVTIELDEAVAEQAKLNFKRQGVDDMIEVIIGDAQVIVAGLSPGFDLIFQDVGDKALYPEMIDDCLRLLNTGGLLLAEDVLFPLFEFDGEYSCLNQMREPLDAFNRSIAKSPRFESALLPIGDGLMVAVKIT